MPNLIKTFHLRVKDKHAKLLLAQAKEVNMVWNFCNETAIKVLDRENRFCSEFELNNLTSGSVKEGFNLNADSIQLVAREYITRRKQFKKRRLNWRVSKGCKRSLGWIPLKKLSIKYKNGQIWYQKKSISLFGKDDLSQYELGQGSFSEDSKGRWYFNTTVKVTQKVNIAKTAIGIDLGLKECAVTSDGEVLEGRNFRKLEPKLAKAQLANKKKQVRSIHAKIKNIRKDELHKFSSHLVKNNGAIFVGDVSSSKLIKTIMAKSVNDAGWFKFKTMLEYKCHWAGVVFKEVNESYSTLTCSYCGAQTGPKGLKDLGIREWTCSNCGTTHGRDVNAAKNILRMGLHTLEEGIPALTAGE